MSLRLFEAPENVKSKTKKDIMDNFVKWIDKNQFTPGCRAYDIGETTVNTIFRYMNGKPIFKCGGRNFDGNGNGALMRILPAAFYVYKIYGKDALNSDNPKYIEAFDELHKMTALTHGHEVSLIACDIYCATLIQMISGKDKANGSEKGRFADKSIDNIGFWKRKAGIFREKAGFIGNIMQRACTISDKFKGF